VRGEERRGGGGRSEGRGEKGRMVPTHKPPHTRWVRLTGALPAPLLIVCLSTTLSPVSSSSLPRDPPRFSPVPTSLPLPPSLSLYNNNFSRTHAHARARALSPAR